MPPFLSQPATCLSSLICDPHSIEVFHYPCHPGPSGVSLGTRRTAGVSSLKASFQAGTRGRSHRESLPLQSEASVGASQDHTPLLLSLSLMRKEPALFIGASNCLSASFRLMVLKNHLENSKRGEPLNRSRDVPSHRV